MVKHISEVRTEDTILDLLKIQGWRTERPPKGGLIRQNEYKNHPSLDGIFRGKSKTGKGDAYPDFLLIDTTTERPLLLIEAKASIKEINKATIEAQHYAEACLTAGHNVLSIGIAGQENTALNIEVFKYDGNNWKTVTYHDNPITWVPTKDDVSKLLSVENLFDLYPVVPEPHVLAEKADLMNRILREAAIKDEYRPAYIGAMMLGLWKTKGKIRKDPEYILGDINRAYEKAFKIAGKEELSSSLRINEANQKLANTAWQIIATLEKLNVATVVFDHDYLGQLYETFFRYTGGNTIGQYFTPRHITRFMADICEVTSKDVVIDPACGTGGFLIAVIQRACDLEKLKYEDVVKLVRNNLIGYESEPLTAALCVANMILRGDGTSGIRNEDVFVSDSYPVQVCNVALMNPPFPHKKTDVPPQAFVKRALEALNTRGRLAVILPTSLIVKAEYREWRKSILDDNSLLAVCELPDEVFQPFASTTTCVVMLEKGITHGTNRKTSFVRIHYDGLTLKKGVRVKRKDGLNQINDAIDAVINKIDCPGFSGVAVITGYKEWAPGAYIPSGIPGENELKESIDELIRRYVSFYTRYAPQIARLRMLIEKGELCSKDYRKLVSKKRLENAKEISDSAEPDTIGEYFDILYGQKELHSRDGIPPGDALIISPTEEYNGTYGWLEFWDLIKPPFVTVAQTGSIGEAFVQSEPCGVNDDCLLLLPKAGKDLPLSSLFIAAAIIRCEKWRFSYGRKLTPKRISDFKMKRMCELEAWVENRLNEWIGLTEGAVRIYKETT